MLVLVGTVGVCVVVVDGIVNCVRIDRCTEKSFQRFQRLNFVQVVNTAVLAELWFKDNYFLNLPDMAEYLQSTLGDTH